MTRIRRATCRRSTRAGAPLAGASGSTSGSASVHQVSRQTGTSYDFIAKRTVPVYESSTRTKVLPAQAATTGANGTFRLVVTVRGGDRSLRGAAAHTRGYRGRTGHGAGMGLGTEEAGDDQGASLVRTGSRRGLGHLRRRRHASKVRFANGITKPQVSRYLFTVLARGLRTATVQGSPSFRDPLHVRPRSQRPDHGRPVHGTGYEVSGRVRCATCGPRIVALDVTLTADQDRYQPGERVTVTVLTRTATGQPTASVFVRAVDEKLFAMGAAGHGRPARRAVRIDRQRARRDGLVPSEPRSRRRRRQGRHHRRRRRRRRPGGLPRLAGRQARHHRRGRPGHGLVRPLRRPHLVAGRRIGDHGWAAGGGRPRPCPGRAAVLRRGRRGAGVPGGRPARGPAPGLRIRLARGDPVRFTVTSDTVPLAAVTADATAFEAVEVELPSMPVGTHRLRVTATIPGRTPALSDTITRTFEVVKTRAAIRSPRHLRPAHAGDDRGRRRRAHAGDARRRRPRPRRADAARGRAGRALPRDVADRGGDGPRPAGRWVRHPGQPRAPRARPRSRSRTTAASASCRMRRPISSCRRIAALSGDRRVNRDALRRYFSVLSDETEGRLPLTRELYLLLGRASLGDASSVRSRSRRRATT